MSTTAIIVAVLLGSWLLAKFVGSFIAVGSTSSIYDDEAFIKSLPKKTEEELWALRNSFESEKVRYVGTGWSHYYREAINLIDRELQKRKGCS